METLEVVPFYLQLEFSNRTIVTRNDIGRISTSNGPFTNACDVRKWRFAVPWVQLAVLTIVAIIVGILAAIMPARRAAKLNPLEALHYE